VGAPAAKDVAPTKEVADSSAPCVEVLEAKFDEPNQMGLERVRFTVRYRDNPQ